VSRTVARRFGVAVWRHTKPTDKARTPTPGETPEPLHGIELQLTDRDGRPADPGKRKLAIRLSCTQGDLSGMQACELALAEGDPVGAIMLLNRPTRSRPAGFPLRRTVGFAVAPRPAGGPAGQRRTGPASAALRTLGGRLRRRRSALRCARFAIDRACTVLAARQAGIGVRVGTGSATGRGRAAFRRIQPGWVRARDGPVFSAVRASHQLRAGRVLFSADRSAASARTTVPRPSAAGLISDYRGANENVCAALSRGRVLTYIIEASAWETGR